ncbi:hypothetical protein L7F22_026908 [Adiantum nelumboides]|nr:hypothetical protein [Adiantum nelumboides]
MEADDNSGAQKEKQEDQREYVACLKCTFDCFNSPHSAPSQLPLTAPSFLKVLDDPSSGWLEIPEAFFGSISLSRSMGEAKLEGPSGWVWYAPVLHDTSNSLGKVGLGSPGWDDFAHDHMLQRGDLLVLTYFSVSRLFKVQIFYALEGTEKSQHCLPSKPHYVSMSHCLVNQKTTSTKELKVNDHKDRGYTSKPEVQLTKYSQEDCTGGHLCLFKEAQNWADGHCVTMNNEDSECKVVKYCSCKSDHYQGRSNGDIAEIEEAENHVHGFICKARSLQHRNKKLKHSTVDEDEKRSDVSKALVPFKHEKITALQGKKHKFSRFNGKGMYNAYAIASTAEKERVDKEAAAFHSKYPFLIKSLSASCIYKDRKLIWPKAFADVYMPQRDTMMTWEDADRKQWKCLWLAQETYRKTSSISAGWASFVKAHHLIEHDVCIFELIKHDAMLFRVHIFKQRVL